MRLDIQDSCVVSASDTAMPRALSRIKFIPKR